MEQSSYAAPEAVDAFESVRPRSPDHATLPILEGFHWDECAARLEPGEWYMVVFRSVRRESGEHLILEMYDYGAYIEARRRAAGLLFYFRGAPNERRECLSFCVWASREEAKRAARLPLHTMAMNTVNEVYESYRLERYMLVKRPGQSSLELHPVTEA